MLEPTYKPADIETKWYDAWQRAGAFARGRTMGSRLEDRPPFTIVIPPPNVTGSLHMGHALNNTLQDIIARQARMTGHDVLWQPGTDHAGIATQMVVERQLEREGIGRHDLGREAFIERVWKWKAESGGTIIGQLHRLGASCDWSRQRFTMDDGLSAAVRKVFVTLHKQGLIYRDKRLVNWDPLLHTAISDLEVEQRDEVGKLWTFRYPLKDQPGRFVCVATTRPETMLGDTAVAVHPDDERYAGWVGGQCVLPIVQRSIPIIADHHADPQKGTGAVKITPAHDFNDFEVGRRHGLAMINVLDGRACMNENAPERFRGLDRFEARAAIVAEMQALGLVERIEDHPMTLPYGDRSGVVVEPWLMDQWFVDAGSLAGPAIAAVEAGRTRFVPEQWTKTYYEWMRNIQPWCISRQIWWGHQIPAWYGPDGAIFVEESEAEARAAAEAHYGAATALRRDEDVLDTWFSSALWPFSTLGWPERTAELARHYPTDLLVTGFDIIFFWVARMMMMGLHFMAEVPFHTVYIHALVRDEHGQKMSKSKGNVIDPLELIERFGADALRFTLTALAVQGRDVRMSESRVEGYRNFCTKLWNAARFCQMNGARAARGFDPATANEPVNCWLVGKLARTIDQATQALAAYRFNDYANGLYHFVWATFCDWYLEFAKPMLLGAGASAQSETRAIAGWALDQILLLLHPVMPFVTEELFAQTAERGGALLVDQPWPVAAELTINSEAEVEIDWVLGLITTIRAMRAEANVPPGAKIALLLRDTEPRVSARLKRHGRLIESLARLETLAMLDGEAPKGAVQTVFDGTSVILPLAEIIDVAAEKARLAKELGQLETEIARLNKKLANPAFLAKAPAEVVATDRSRLEAAAHAMAKLGDAARRLAEL